MKNGKKYIFANLQNAGATISFTLLLFTAFLAACATPTVSSDDDSDEISDCYNSDIDYGSMTDERDGKVYKTVIIGTQVWMAENLNYYDAANLNVKEKSWCFGKSDNGDSTT